MTSTVLLEMALRDLDFLGLSFSNDDYYRVAKNFYKRQERHKLNYDQSWSGVKKIIDQLINEGNDLAFIVANLYRPSADNQVSRICDGILLPIMKEFNIKYDLGEFKNTPGKTLAALNGGYSLIDKRHINFIHIDCLLENLSYDVDCLAEFGAGWGGNLIRTLMGSARSDINYVACEQSQSGRECFDALFGCLDGLKFSSYEFDFCSPNLDMVKGHKHLLAFTCAAIEQIAFLPMSFFDKLFASADKVTLVMYEPIGWQRSIQRSRYCIQSYFDEIGGKKHPASWHSNNYVYNVDNNYFLDNAANWSLTCRYNMNLLSLVKQLTDTKKAELTRLDYDVYSNNPFNPYSLLVLTKS